MEEVAGKRRHEILQLAFRRLINRKITTPQPRTNPLRVAGPGHIFLQLFQRRCTT